MLVLSSPSGAGKTSIAQALLGQDDNLCLSVSVTTRSPRNSEVHGVDYTFVTDKVFYQMVDDEAFFEYAEVFGNLYGTPKAPIELLLAEGKDIIFDIDWQGTQQLAQHLGQDLVRVFILPPNYEELRNRLMKRGLDSEEEIAKRMHEAFAEISHWAEYDYVVVNDDFEQSIHSIRSILESERLKRRHQKWLSDFVGSLYKASQKKSLKSS